MYIYKFWISLTESCYTDYLCDFLCRFHEKTKIRVRYSLTSSPIYRIWHNSYFSLDTDYLNLCIFTFRWAQRNTLVLAPATVMDFIRPNCSPEVVFFGPAIVMDLQLLFFHIHDCGNTNYPIVAILRFNFHTDLQSLALLYRKKNTYE